MFRLRNAAFALLTVGALALAGCAGQERSTAEKAEPDVMTLLRTEVQASLQNAAEKTEKSKSVAFTMNVTAQGTQVTGKGALSYGPPPAMTMTMNTGGSRWSHGSWATSCTRSCRGALPPRGGQAVAQDGPGQGRR